MNNPNRDLMQKNVLALMCTDGLHIGLFSQKKLLGSYLGDGLNIADVLVDKINELLNKHNFNIKELDVLAIINGPGSFSAIRAGAVVSNILSVTLNLPILSFHYFELLNACFLRDNTIERGLIIHTLNIGSTALICGIFNYKKEILPPIIWDLDINGDKIDNIVVDYIQNHNHANIYVIGSMANSLDTLLEKYKSKAVIEFNKNAKADIGNIINLTSDRDYIYHVEPLYVSKPNIIIKKYGV